MTLTRCSVVTPGKCSREPTDAERHWHRLRDRRLDGFKFRRQTPVDGYVVDFYCEAAARWRSTRIAIPATEPDALEYDRRRSAHLANLRIRVLRFPNHEVIANPDAVAVTILPYAAQGGLARPTPSPAGTEHSSPPVSTSPVGEGWGEGGSDA